MSAVLLKLFYDGAAQGFAGGVKSRTILLHPINTPQALIHNMAGMRFSENLHPTHSHSWRPQLENQGHAHKITHILILWPSTSLYQSSRPAPSFTFFLSLPHTHAYSHTQGRLTSQLQCQWRHNGFQSSPVIRIWRSVCSNVWGTIAAKNERRRKTMRKEKR